MDRCVCYDVPQNHITEDSFCFVVLPDSQHYVKDPKNLCCWDSQLSWLFNNYRKLNIKFVTHVGDLSNDENDEEQFRQGFFKLGRLCGVVPFGICAGNHDMFADGSSPYFEKYFPEAICKFRPDWIGSYDQNKHNAQKIEVNGKSYLFIHLAYLPSDGAIEWAKKILEDNPDSYAIISTHAFLIADWTECCIARKDSRVSLTDYRINHDGTNAGEDILEKLVKPYDNVRMVVNGHYVGRYYEEIQIDERKVHAMVADYSGEQPYGGNGFLRILQFVPSENKIYVYSYSPLLDAYKLGIEDSFVLELNQ